MLKLIKDPVVGNTVLSSIETGILEMPVINRLHHLMQNGLAYRVFPSDTTSRFEHSIGVMHLSGEMYCRSMANALPKTRDRFLLKAWRTVLAPAQGNKSSSDPLLANPSQLPEAIADVLGPEFFNHHPGPNLSCRVPHLRAAHVILLQAVRLSGLLHDVGHFPCSHLFEDALRLMASHGLPRDFKGHLENIRNFVKELAPNLKDAAPHEQAGFLIARAVLYERMAKGGRTTAIKDAVNKRIVLATLRILGHRNEQNEPKGIAGALSELLCGDLDADRLDFVLRDGRRTGMMVASGDVDRILKMMCLTETKLGFRFCPAIQTLNDVQQCLLDRLRLYQYVYNHHRVWRLENMLKYGIRVMLKYAGPDRDQLTSMFTDLEALGGDIKPALLNDILARIALRNDNWLLTLVQSARQNAMQPEEKECTEELFSGNKTWTSLWKREFEYHSFLIQAVRAWLDKDAKLIQALHWLFQDTFQSRDKERDDYQYNLSKLTALMARKADTLDNDTLAWLGAVTVRTVLSRAESKLVCGHHIPHVMICPTRFHPGIYNLCLVDIKSVQRSIKKFCRLALGMRDFLRVYERSIAMHVFIRRDCDPDVVEKQIMETIFKILKTVLPEETEPGLKSTGDICDIDII